MPKKCPAPTPAPPIARSSDAYLARLVAPYEGDMIEDGLRTGSDQLMTVIDAVASTLPPHVESTLFALHARLLVLADLRRQELSDLNE